MTNDPLFPKSLKLQSQNRGALSVVQNCYVVDRLESASERLHDLYGVGPFVGFATVELGNHQYRGNPAPPILLRSAFVQSGDLNLELVELLSGAPSAFHDMYPFGEEGFHHVAVFCNDYTAERDRLVSAGLSVASEFRLNIGVTICYLDARATLGHMIELCPEHEVIRKRYQQARDAASNWNGENLFLPWAH